MEKVAMSITLTFLLLATTVISVLSIPVYQTHSQPSEETFTFTVEKDSFLRKGFANTNEGSNPILRVRALGENRALVAFNQSEIDSLLENKVLISATLSLYIVDNGNNWGASGRTIDAHMLSENWAEGNGWNDGGLINGYRGDGSGVTWNCAIDSNIANIFADCASQWDGGSFSTTPSNTVLVTNGMENQWIEFNVTSDVQSFLDGSNTNYGWLVKKTDESAHGLVEFASKEAIANNPILEVTYAAPEVILANEYFDSLEDLDVIGQDLDETVIDQELVDEINATLTSVKEAAVELQNLGYDGNVTTQRVGQRMIGTVTFFNNETQETFLETQIQPGTLGIFFAMGLSEEYSQHGIDFTFEQLSGLLESSVDVATAISDFEDDKIASDFILASVAHFHPSTGHTFGPIGIAISAGFLACLNVPECRQVLIQVIQYGMYLAAQYAFPLAHITGLKFYDVNSDGNMDVEDYGLANWNFTMYSDENGFFWSEHKATTSGAGYFDFGEIYFSRFITKFVIFESLPPGWEVTTPGPEPGVDGEVQWIPFEPKPPINFNFQPREWIPFNGTAEFGNHEAVPADSTTFDPAGFYYNITLAERSPDILIDSGKDRLYALHQNGIYVYDISNPDVISLVTEIVTSPDLGDSLDKAALHQGLNKLYVDANTPNSEIFVFDTITNTFTGTINLPSASIYNMVVDESRNRLYLQILGNEGKELMVIDTTTDTVINTVHTDESDDESLFRPTGIAVNPLTHDIYMLYAFDQRFETPESFDGAGVLQVINPDTLEVEREIVNHVNEWPNDIAVFAPSLDYQRIVTGQYDGFHSFMVSIYNVNQDYSITNIALPDQDDTFDRGLETQPLQLNIDEDHGHIWASLKRDKGYFDEFFDDQVTGSVAVINIDNGQTLNRFYFPQDGTFWFPGDINANSETNRVYVSTLQGFSISVIKTPTVDGQGTTVINGNAVADGTTWLYGPTPPPSESIDISHVHAWVASNNTSVVAFVITNNGNEAAVITRILVNDVPFPSQFGRFAMYPHPNEEPVELNELPPDYSPGSVNIDFDSEEEGFTHHEFGNIWIGSGQFKVVYVDDPDGIVESDVGSDVNVRLQIGIITKELSIPVEYNDNSLGGRWEFDEGTGTVTTDSSGNGNTATLSDDPTWLDGADCIQGTSCLSFNGVDNLVYVERDESIEPVDEMSISMWIKPVLSEGTLIDKALGSNHSYNVYLEPKDGDPTRAELIWCLTTDGIPTCIGENDTEVLVDLNSWQFVTFTYDGGRMVTFVYGQGGAAVDVSGTISYDITQLLIGTDAELSNFYNGAMDDVRIYTRALSSDEIDDIYQAEQ